MELNLSKATVQTMNVLKIHHATSHSSNHHDSEFELQTEFTVEWRKREENGGGIKGGISCSEPSLGPPDPTPDSTALTLLSFPQPLNTFSFQKTQESFFLIFHKMSGWDERTEPHTFCGCLVSRFYTLHSSADGLSIDFDLTCLCSALCAWGVGVWRQYLTV